MAEPKKTPLYEMHVKYGGKIIDFGGWALPVQFPTGIIEEHRTTRTKAGLFDVSHMGEFRVTGKDPLGFIQKCVVNDIGRGVVGQCIYSPMCYPTGGVVDDLITYRLGEKEWLIVVNAANMEKDLAWMTDILSGFPGTTLVNESAETAELALQGPLAETILQKLTGTDLKSIAYYHLRDGVAVAGAETLVSRTGYTGEDGFEIFSAPEDAVPIWEAIMDVGKPLGLIPVGLGARDTLRFEACMPLYGQELDAERTPLEAGLDRFVSFDKGDYIGRDALLAQKEKGLERKLVGIEMIGRGIPRHGYRVLDAEGKRETGYVTTGSYCPSLEKNLGLAYVPVSMSGIGQKVNVDIRGKAVEAVVVRKPFYKRVRPTTG
ncbi:MAG: glycine cleavage system aminomethyltransferase GcvT [Bacillota bacterium]|nr:MAG: glycine cleavage system aminomethyltransferase GcvT [Bacillota bacterium]